MQPSGCSYVLAARLVLAVLLSNCAVRAQEPPPQPAPPPPLEDDAEPNAASPCLEPPPMVRWEDYEGPFHKTVGALTRKLERKSAPPHYKPDTVLCSLELGDKFFLFVQDTVDPLSFLSAGFNAGLDQAGDKYPRFGQGATGYGKRFGANFLGQTSHAFFTEFAYPTIFSEDPRYYRLAHGSTKSRVFHAAAHAFVAHRDNGKHIFNVSEWLGTASAVALSNTYYPGGRRGFGPEARQVAYAVLQDIGRDVLREFWPEIAHKLKMPFRDRPEPRTELSSH